MAGRKKPQAAPSFSHCLLLLWKNAIAVRAAEPRRGKVWGAEERGIPARALEPRLKETTFPTAPFPGQEQLLKSTNSQPGSRSPDG